MSFPIQVSKALRVAPALVLMLACGLAAKASQLNVLYSFCTQTNCTDGRNPTGGVIRDPATGNLFGTTPNGGQTGNSGTGFEVIPKGKKTKFEVLNTFCPDGNCSDGTIEGGLIEDVNGTIYGTTATGEGASSEGMAFSLTPSGKKWKFKTLYSFPGKGQSATNPIYLTYAGADTGALYDGTSALYGVAQKDGISSGGAIFALTKSGKKWKESVLYNFCSQSNCTDGFFPNPGLAIDGSGNIYGTTAAGGANTRGTIFELSPQGGGSWSETVLYSFCSGVGCPDGADPKSGVVRDASGNFFGNTAHGGSDGINQGTVYELAANSQYTVLHSFCLGSCTDGMNPNAPLLLDGQGNLFGTTDSGGTGVEPGGIIFEIHNGQFIQLYNFCVDGFCTDGEEPSPYAPLAIDTAGNLYGTTQGGGAHRTGEVFQFKP